MAKDNEMVLQRTFDHPPERVFAAFTDPDTIDHWWGPNGFTTTTESMEVRPGGVWKFVMHGPDGKDYPNKITYTEVIPSKKLVYIHTDDQSHDPVSFEAVITFEDLHGQTLVTLRTIFASPEERDKNVDEVGAIEGGLQTLRRLAAFLENQE